MLAVGMAKMFLRTDNYNMNSQKAYTKVYSCIFLAQMCLSYAAADKEVVSIMLDNRDVRECLCCTHHRLSVLVFRANTTFGAKVRNALKMVDPEKDPYYDPDSSSKILGLCLFIAFYSTYFPTRAVQAISRISLAHTHS